MKPTQILRVSFASLILVMAISVNQPVNGKTPDVNDILKSAQKGNPNSQVCLGLMYGIGDGVAQDYKESLKWFTKAAEQGIAAAQFNVGLMFYHGKGVPQDYKEAFKWFTKAVEQGLSSAQYGLGIMYEKGHGVPKDYKEAIKWYTKAAEQGLALAQYNLGGMYYDGNGVPQDYKAAFVWFTKAAEQGLTSAQYNLGVMYDKGKGVPQDYKETFKWYTSTAEQGLASAQCNLGVMYDKGKGVLQDYKEAIKWYIKAAEQGLASAQYNLGWMYTNGNGVSKDYKEAFKWYTKAAEQGYAKAQFNLGLMFGKGECVPKDYIQAYKWIILASAQGQQEAMKLRDSLNQVMSTEQIAGFVGIEACKSIFSEKSTFVLRSPEHYRRLYETSEGGNAIGDRDEGCAKKSDGGTAEFTRWVASCWTVLKGSEPTCEEWDIFKENDYNIVAIVSTPSKVCEFLNSVLEPGERKGFPFYPMEHREVEYEQGKVHVDRTNITSVVPFAKGKSFIKQNEYRFVLTYGWGPQLIDSFIFCGGVDYMEKCFVNPEMSEEYKKYRERLLLIISNAQAGYGDFTYKEMGDIIANADILFR